jgi:ATP-dependent DNA helicase RecQ
VPPVACFTATAKLDVLQEIVLHFREALDQKLEVFQGDIERDNLRFEVQPVTRPEKFPRVQELLAERLADEGSAVVYTATRKGAEDAAQYLARQGWPVRAYHAGLTAAQKREVQDAFVRGSVRVICATNAFGMGIDKDDVRVVIHVDLPGSLENYLQEAGRAGRDARSAECVLLFTDEDVETQFQLASRSQLTQRDISQILRGLRRARHKDNVVIITSGELLGDEQVETTFEADDQMADTKVKTAVAWLERSGFLERNENRTNVFQGRPLVGDMKEAEVKIAKLGLPERKQRQWLAVLEALFKCERPEGLNADDLAQLPALREGSPTAEGRERSDETDSQRVVRMLHEMAEAGLVKQGLLLSAFIRYKVKDSSTQRLGRASAVETAVLRTAQELAPDAEDHNWQYLSLRRMNQALVDQGLESSPELLRSLLVSLSRDGKGFAQSHATLEFRHCYGEHYRVQLRRDWATALELSQKRRAVARIILDTILAKIPTETPAGADLLVEFSTDEIAEAIRKDLILAGLIKDTLAAIDRGLMYLHEQKAIILQHGLAVFRQAMTIHMLPRAKGRRYTKAEFDPLARHYEERIFQVHVMSEYARRGLESMPRGLELVASYFRDPRPEFVARFFGGRQDIITRAITQEAYQAIVENLRNPEQIVVVAASEDRNMLIMAGPGSGKTRAVVHRVAYLVKVKRVRARSILVLCFNRRAAIELRVRLRELIGAETTYVDVMTYHGLAMRLTGTSFAERCSRPGDEPLDFDALIVDAARILRGETSLPGVEADELRDRLLAEYRFILVDEYQDIDAPQYDLISALADRTGRDPDAKLNILAVGDDDQNIYAFRGTSVEFIQRFERDYAAAKHYLVENYRSTANIISAANALITRNQVRMKADRPIQINRTREKDAPGGAWARLDPQSSGKVQVLRVGADQSEAMAIVAEMRRLHHLQPSADWSSFAVLARTKHLFPAIRALCEHNGIPVSWNLENDRIPRLHRIREFATFLDMIAERREQQLTVAELLAWCKSATARTNGNPWKDELVRLLETWREETADSPMPGSCLMDFFYEALAEQRREQRLGRGVFLSTIHAAKGTEFDHVLIPASGWTMPSVRQDVEEERRLLYVGMTRARCTLALIDSAAQHNPYLAELNEQHVLRRAAASQESVPPGLLERSYVFLGMTDLYLDFAARCEPEHPIHAAIARLQPDSRLQHRLRGPGVELVDANGCCVAQLSQTAASTWRSQLASVEEIRVMAVVRRLRTDSKPEYRDACRCDRWEVPLVEIVHHDCAGPAR